MIDQFNRASLRAVHQGRTMATQMAELRDSWRETLRARSHSAAWKILDLLPAHPVIDAAMIERRIGLSAKNVGRTVVPLVEAGILVSKQHDKSRKLLYRAPAMLELLDDYAAEVGRRQR